MLIIFHRNNLELLSRMYFGKGAEGDLGLWSRICAPRERPAGLGQFGAAPHLQPQVIVPASLCICGNPLRHLLGSLQPGEAPSILSCLLPSQHDEATSLHSCLSMLLHAGICMQA